MKAEAGTLLKVSRLLTMSTTLQVAQEAVPDVNADVELV